MPLNKGVIMYAENYLIHYGILGMHWGKRKAIDSNLPALKSKRVMKWEAHFKEKGLDSKKAELAAKKEFKPRIYYLLLVVLLWLVWQLTPQLKSEKNVLINS